MEELDCEEEGAGAALPPNVPHLQNQSFAVQSVEIEGCSKAPPALPKLLKGFGAP